MTDTIPFSVVIIKPLSIGRGDGPRILSDLLSRGNLSLRKMRTWDICNTTWRALYEISKDTPSEFPLPSGLMALSYQRTAWVCLLTAKLRDEDVTDRLFDVCGPEDMRYWKTGDLRHIYSAYKVLGVTTHPSDTVVYISPEGKSKLVADLLFSTFHEEEV